MTAFFLIVTLLLHTSSLLADEYVVMSNGMTCWKNDNGHIWGCNGGTNTDGHFVDTKTNEIYNPIGGNQAIGSRGGMPFNTSYKSQNDSYTPPKQDDYSNTYVPSNEVNKSPYSSVNRSKSSTQEHSYSQPGTLHERLNRSANHARAVSARKPKTKIYNCGGTFTDQPCEK